MTNHLPQGIGVKLRSIGFRGIFLCARWKNEVFALRRRRAASHIRSLLAG
jgi:hypothetical protein